MHSNPLLSIIFPVYNVDQYLDESLDSICKQTFQDYELIIVNDGSTDNSLSICSQYALKDKRVTIINKQNGGLSSARNAGLDIAQGQYVTFIDSDDTISPDVFELNLRHFQNNPEIQALQYPIYKFYNTPKETIEIQNEPFLINGVDNIICNLLSKTISTSQCNKIYKKDVIRDIRFPLLRKNEDSFFLSSLIPELSSFYISNQGIYYYWFRHNSITTSAYTADHWKDISDSTTSIFLLSTNLQGEISKYKFRWYFNVLRSSSIAFVNYKKNKDKEASKEITELKIKVLKCKISFQDFYRSNINILQKLIFLPLSVLKTSQIIPIFVIIFKILDLLGAKVAKRLS